MHGPTAATPRGEGLQEPGDQGFAAPAYLSSTSRTDFRVASTVPPSGFNLLGCPERRREKLTGRLAGCNPHSRKLREMRSGTVPPAVAANMATIAPDAERAAFRARTEPNGGRHDPVRIRPATSQPLPKPRQPRLRADTRAAAGSEPGTGGGGVTRAHGGRYLSLESAPCQRARTSRSRE